MFCIYTVGWVRLIYTFVVGTVKVAPLTSRNAIGIKNDDGNRVSVQFDYIIFKLDKLFGKSIDPPIEKVIVPKLDPSMERTPPANDVTYLDREGRIVRGGDGALFIFVREDSYDSTGEPTPMLTSEQRKEVVESISANGKQVGGAQKDVYVGNGIINQDSASPELKFLFQSQEKARPSLDHINQ